MMDIRIVWIYPQTGVRYIDSMWASDEHAQARKIELQNSFKGAGNPVDGNRHQVWIQEGKIADAAVQEAA